MALPRNIIKCSIFIPISIFLACCLSPVIANSANWLNHGGDLYNRRYAQSEVKMSPKTVSKLKLKWEYFAGKDISATPSIFEGVVYFPSWNGYIHAVKACDGSLVWKKSVEELTGFKATGFILNINVSVSRATPTIAGNLLIVSIYGPAVVIALNRGTGELIWSTLLDSHNASVITMSGTVYNGGFYVGTSSVEEGASIDECCTFIGSMAKLDVSTGAVLWQTFTLPDNGGAKGLYAGGAIWGSSPSIDITRNHVYVATGNLYSAPPDVLECQEKENNQTVPSHPDQCVEAGNHENSFLAFDMDTGEIKWYKQLGGYDLWFFACRDLSTPGCPPGPKPDADFGEAPMMLSVVANGRKRDIVAAVQKSGYAWALDRDNGDVLWSTVAGPGGIGGGGTWGAATDGQTIYTNIANSDRKNITLVPSKKITSFGTWVAIRASTGKVIWSIANPRNSTASGPVSLANNVLFAGSDDPEGSLFAIHAKTGKILWTTNSGASVHGGVSVSDGCVYVGNGYNVTIGVGVFTAGTSLYAFCISWT